MIDISETLHKVRETLTVLRAAQGEPAFHHAEGGDPHEAGSVLGAIAALSWALDLLREEHAHDTEAEVRRLRRSALEIYELHAERLRKQ